jgi:hypothetical protein
MPMGAITGIRQTSIAGAVRTDSKPLDDGMALFLMTFQNFRRLVTIASKAPL